MHAYAIMHNYAHFACGVLKSMIDELRIDITLCVYRHVSVPFMSLNVMGAIYS